MPTGKMAPIRVDEDGYVMLRSSACDCITDEKAEARIAELETRLSATRAAFDVQRAEWAKKFTAKSPQTFGGRRLSTTPKDGYYRSVPLAPDQGGPASEYWIETESMYAERVRVLK